MLTEKRRSRTKSKTKKRMQKKAPAYWPSTTAWPLSRGVTIIAVYESLPPKFQLSNGKVVNGVTPSKKSKRKYKRSSRKDGSDVPFNVRAVDGKFVIPRGFDDWLYEITLVDQQDNIIGYAEINSQKEIKFYIEGVPSILLSDFLSERINEIATDFARQQGVLP